MYAMFVVVKNTKKIKKIVNALNEIGIKGATIIDTMGGGNYYNNYLGSRPAIGSALRTIEDVSIFNKTIISIVYCEKHVIDAMDAIEAILGGDMKKPNSGIIFTVPVVAFRGGELEKYVGQYHCF
ncbi:MAG: hypothetical protein PWP27_317 [Clostridiales bacterium]|jgi:nitrogen regulatory protein PII|nr:hypothetical protein [Clostridiales bacterium]MDK2932507.1 hypothetical protein [Clostridiales bacterium]